MKHNKLVRDKIPEFLSKLGKNPKFHIADDGEYKDNLRRCGSLSHQYGDFCFVENFFYQCVTFIPALFRERESDHRKSA